MSIPKKSWQRPTKRNLAEVNDVEKNDPCQMNSRWQTKTGNFAATPDKRFIRKWKTEKKKEIKEQEEITKEEKENASESLNA